ncbi:MAG: transposase [Burkholderiaceae bacterium]|nr:transposase [Burkholderiaceae bacterium]
MILAHKIELDATFKQRKYFASAAGCARFVWNRAVAEWDRQYADGEKPSGMKLAKEFNATKYDKFPWMKLVHRDAHARPFLNLDKAYKGYFKKISQKPKFKKKGRCKDSFAVANDKFRLDGKSVVLPKIGSVRLREELRFTGKIMGAVVSRTADRWFIAIQVDVGEHHKPRTGNGVVGVDLGLNVTAMVSDGQRLVGPKSLKSNLKKLRRASRSHSRKQKGSQNRKKASRRLARIHAKVANVRNDWLHKQTTKLARENQAVYFETLSVKNMVKNRKLSRAISDAGWAEITRQAEYKSAIYGGVFGKIDRWHPSSKECNQCGQIKKDLKLSDRVYRCDGCGHEEDRDLNAAKNIRTAGLAGSYAHGPEGADHRRKAKMKPCRVEVGTKPCPQVDTL